ncbi:MAG: TIGR00730 family Rossman fold protein [Janthinobacterium lividum]
MAFPQTDTPDQPKVSDVQGVSTSSVAGPNTPEATNSPAPLPQAPLAYQNPEFLDSPDGRLLRILAEYSEPMARFRRERIQDTVVFFGSARFRGLDVAHQQLELLANQGSEEPAPAEEQPATGAELAQETTSDLKRKRAEAAVEMARFYEDARTLAHQMATWAKKLPGRRHRFVVTSGGGPGIMEAANRGAWEAGAKTIGLNIVLPFEQVPNRYITPALNFNFHYFFMRKYWFAYLAKALVVFPGGFGTLDEMFELLTLDQTGKLAKKITVVLYGSDYWKGVINMDFLLEKGAIAPKDKDIFQFADTPEEAFQLLTDGLTRFHLDDKPEADRTGDPIPSEPAASAQEQLGPDIARTRP